MEVEDGRREGKFGKGMVKLEKKKGADGRKGGELEGDDGENEKRREEAAGAKPFPPGGCVPIIFRCALIIIVFAPIFSPLPIIFNDILVSKNEFFPKTPECRRPLSRA
ncbi:MAG: hypothetical protein K2K81_10060 [Muribaculaceae bacterium]|nr:hypothetical protein [Muribaculaceae bacterium]